MRKRIEWGAPGKFGGLFKSVSIYQKPRNIKKWYNKVHDYAWGRFPDPENGEWFGYLNREAPILA